MEWITALGLLLAACAAIVAVAIGGTVLLGSGLRGLRSSTSSPARNICIALVVALLGAFGALLLTGNTSSSAQVFAQSGAERWIAGPVIYLSFGAVLLFDRRRPSPLRAILPSFLSSPVGLLLLLALAEAGVSLILGGTTVTLVAQGLALVAGFVVFLLAGRLSAPWDASSRRFFLLTVVTFSVVALVLGRTPGSLPALGIPAMATLVAVGLVGRGVNQVLRLAAFVLGVGVIAYLYVSSQNSTDPSDGLTLQIVLSGAVVALVALPRSARRIGGVVAAAVIVSGVVLSPLPQVTVGQGVDDTDLTISQRAYETATVWNDVTASPVTILLGEGPGATVDLSHSPDRETLAASGRDLTAVPSVHLLTSYLLLKFGLCGLLWLAAVTIMMLRLTTRELSAQRPPLTAVLLLALAWSGLAAAVPAATFFFSNPLCSLAIGLLLGRTSIDQPLDATVGLTERPLSVI